MGSYKLKNCFPGDEEEMSKHGLASLEEGIESFLRSHGHAGYDRSLTPKIGRFILTLTSVEPTIPLKGRRLRDLSSKQRVLFQSKEYEGTEDGEFLGHWFEPGAFFIFSRRTVNVAKSNTLIAPSAVHKTVARLCHERPDPVISYGKLSMAVPRFVRDMQGKMKYMSVSSDYRFENTEKPGVPGARLCIRTFPVNLLLSVLDHQDMNIHLGKDFVAIYGRWFGMYIEGE